MCRSAFRQVLVPAGRLQSWLCASFIPGMYRLICLLNGMGLSTGCRSAAQPLLYSLFLQGSHAMMPAKLLMKGLHDMH